MLCAGLAGLVGWMMWGHTGGADAPDLGPATLTNPPVSVLASPPAPPRTVAVTGAAPATWSLPTPPQARAVAQNLDGEPGVARPVRDVLEAQVALARQGISPGSIDGALGLQTRAALNAWQRRQGLAPTGTLDGDTRAGLLLDLPLFTNVVVTSNDLERLLPVAGSWLGKSSQARLDYESLLELVAERACTHPQLVRRLNEGVRWERVSAGTALTVPRVELPAPRSRAAWVQISLAEKVLEAFDANTNLLYHCPCSIGRLAEKRPVGELHVTVLAPDPNYTFNPGVFPESAEARELGRKLVLPPGPNNPVGSAWIGLDRPGYGIHGTPAPELVGRTESHGCFRLANWNAGHLLKLVAVGTPVRVEP